MSVREFVVFNAAGKPIDWIDPYEGHEETGPGLYLVTGALGHVYDVVVPKGGRFEVREMKP